VGRIALQPPATATPADMARFLRALRGLLRGSTACAVVVYPVGALPAAAAAALRHAVDAAVVGWTLIPKP
jgi:hypothetical protein